MKQAGCLILIIIAIILYYAFDTGYRQNLLIERKQVEQNYINKLNILNDKWIIDRHGYSTITFSIINNGDMTTKYVKATVRFYDSKGSIIDSTYTNTLEKIPPGASKIFEVIHKTPQKAKTMSVFVEEVVLNN
jgi:hypothetical protein